MGDRRQKTLCPSWCLCPIFGKQKYKRRQSKRHHRQSQQPLPKGTGVDAQTAESQNHQVQKPYRSLLRNRENRQNGHQKTGTGTGFWDEKAGQKDFGAEKHQ